MVERGLRIVHRESRRTFRAMIAKRLITCIDYSWQVDHIHPDWHMLDQFAVTTTQEALNLDALESSHPIQANVENPSEIEAIFDVISYKKGAALIRMLENFLKFDVLRAGLSRYLHKYQFRNAKTRDLWRCLSEAVPNSAINVSAIMDRWVKQKGARNSRMLMRR